MGELKEYLCIEEKAIEHEDRSCYRFTSATKSAPEACMEPVYLKSEADKVIAELKDKCEMHDFFWEGCGFARRGFKNTISVSEEFDRIEAENARLRVENRLLKERFPERWMAVTSPPKNMRDVWIRTADGTTIPGHYNYSKKVWYDHDSYNPVEAVGWQELGPVVSEEYAFLEAENAQLKEAIAVYQRNEKLDIRDIHQLKRALWVTRTAMAKFEKDRWNAHVDCGNRLNRKDPAFIKTGKLLTVSEWRKLWADIERKCHAKAEEQEWQKKRIPLDLKGFAEL